MQITPPFGRLITAMVTPFSKSGEIDWAGLEKIAAHLVSTGHDGIAVNGTTGEAPTTSDDEKDQIIKAVRKVVGDKIKIIAGAGNNETSHSVEQAQRAAKAGADGLLTKPNIRLPLVPNQTGSPAVAVDVSNPESRTPFCWNPMWLNGYVCQSAW